MPKRLQTRDPGFEAAFVAFLGEKREASDDVGAAVAAIIADVRARGDAALIELSKKFDRVDLGKLGLRVSAAEIRAAREACSAETLDALQLAADRIAEHHARQLPMNERYTDELGVELGWRWTAVESVGLYVPGGPRLLSQLGADERHPGQGRRRAARRHGRAVAERRAQPAGAGRRRAGRRRGDLSRRRRAGRRRRSPTARRRSRPSPRSSGPATPTSPPPSGWCSAPSASTASPARPRC